MKKTMIAVFAALAMLGCENDNISACGRACKNADAQMVKWSKTDGCVCSAAAANTTTEPAR